MLQLIGYSPARLAGVAVVYRGLPLTPLLASASPFTKLLMLALKAGRLAPATTVAFSAVTVSAAQEYLRWYDYGDAWRSAAVQAQRRSGDVRPNGLVS